MDSLWTEAPKKKEVRVSCDVICLSLHRVAMDRRAQQWRNKVPDEVPGGSYQLNSKEKLSGHSAQMQELQWPWTVQSHI